MKQWNGLLKKEWAMMSGQFYAVMIASILFTLLIPVGSNLLNIGLGALELSLLFSGIWMAIGVLIPTIMLLISLGKEMSRPDILLHSTASIFKVFGSKAVFSGLVGAVSIAIPMLIIIVGSRYSDWLVDYPFQLVLELGGLLYVLLYIQSLLVMCQGLFFGVLYQLIKPAIKGFAVPVVAILFIFFSWTVARISSTATYENITKFGPIIGLDQDIFSMTKGNNFLKIDLTSWYTGAVIFDLLLAVLLFICAMLLFEKKVRI